MTRKVMASTLVLESLLSVSFLLALRLYHGNPDKKHKLQNIAYQFAGAAGILLHINRKLTIGKLTSPNLRF